VPPELRRGNGELLLVVDDEQSVREMVAIGLTSQGYRVVSAPNGAEAIDWLEKHPGEARLVLLDTDMPVLNGRATADFLRVRVPALPILLMSGEGGTIAGDDKDARLSKPFALEELLRAVARRLAGRRSE
jgi:CheY-like chemotaxis protein